MNLGPQQVFSAGGAVPFVPSFAPAARFGFDSVPASFSSTCARERASGSNSRAFP